MNSQNKKVGNNSISFGIGFIIIGVVIFLLTRGVLFTAIVAIVDAIFGIALIVIGISDKKKALAPQLESSPVPAAVIAAPTYTPEKDFLSDGFDDDFGSPEAPTEFDAAPDDGFDDFDDFGDTPEPENTNDVAALTQRENQLRQEVRLATEDAHIAADDAARAQAISEKAEAELVEAQNRVKMLYGAQQQDALRTVDALAKKAMQASQDAAVAARKASIASRVLEQKKEQHRQAMAAAASAMAALDDDNF